MQRGLKHNNDKIVKAIMQTEEKKSWKNELTKQQSQILTFRGRGDVFDRAEIVRDRSSRS